LPCAEQIFNMQFTARQLNKQSQKAEKEAAKEKKKIKAVRMPCNCSAAPPGTNSRPILTQAIEKGNREGAQIYAENTIRKKNEALQMLQCVVPAYCSCRHSALRQGLTARAFVGTAGSRRGLTELHRSSNRSKHSEGCGTANRTSPTALNPAAGCDFAG
jgi:charged multivesicular body protein 1